MKQQDKLSADKYTNNLVNILLLLATFAVAIVLLFTQPIVKIFAKGFTGETLELAIRLTKISVFGIYFSAVLSISGGYLRLHNNYVIPALIGFPFNFILILSLILSAKTNIFVLAIGSIIATGSQFLLLVPSIRKSGFNYKPVINLNDKYIKMMVAMALPIIISQSVNRINVLVDRTLASSIAVGGISALNYADKLGGFIIGLFVSSLTTVIYPVISKLAVEGNVRGLKTYISETISVINLVVFPATIGAMLFSKEIVTLLFGRGAFTPEAIQMTAVALFFYSIGMTPLGMREVLSRSFYAFQDTKTPMINATIGCNIEHYTQSNFI